MAKQSRKSLIPQPVTSMANGVSQQSPAMRLQSQIETAINARCSVAAGTGTRTGTEHKASYALGVEASKYDHCYPVTFDRGEYGVYGVLVLDGDLKVFNLETGIQSSVTFPQGKAYIPNNPEDNVRHVAAGDYLFLTNRQKITAMATDTTPALVNEGFIFCRAANYQEVIQIDLTRAGTTLTWKAKMPSTSGGNGPLSSLNVALAIETILTTNAAPAAGAIQSDSGSWTVVSAPATTATAAGYTVERRKGLLRISRADAGQFDLAVQDQDNTKKVYGIQRSIQKFTDLPEKFWPGAIIEVSADASNGTQRYWVKYEDASTSPSASAGGSYVECPAPGTTYQFDASTLPWALRATADTDAFEFAPVDWENRPIGNDVSIPAPSFIGQPVNDLFFIGGRLGFLFFDGIATSRSGDKPKNFWRETSTDLLDTDPIDLINGGADSVEFHSCGVVGAEIVCLSNDAQYVVTVPSNQALSPKYAELRPASKYQTEKSCAPIAYGTSIFYASPGGEFSSVHQYTMNNDNERTGNSQDVTSHVPAYVKAPVVQFASCKVENLLFALTGQNRRDIFVYEFIDTEQQGRIQSAWSWWTFDSTASIVGMFVSNRKVFFMIRRGTTLYLEVMDVGSNKLIGTNADLILLDRKADQDAVALAFDTLDGGTYITLPYGDVEDIGYYVVLTYTDSKGVTLPSKILDLNKVLGSTFKVIGHDITNVDFVVGRAPRVYIEPTEPLLRDESGNPTFQDASVASIGPILGRSQGMLMRVSSKQRRNYAKLLTIGDALTRNEGPEGGAAEAVDMLTPRPIVPGNGEYAYIISTEYSEKTPKRFYKTAGNANDVLVSFENHGPRSFRVVGMMWMLSPRGSVTGL